MSARALARALAAALLVAAAPVCARVDPADFKAVGDKATIALDPAKSYLIVQTSSGSAMYSFPVTFIRRPEAADIADYLERRKAALAKAHAKWEKKHAGWVSSAAAWDKETAHVAERPKEPVEPTDTNLAFPAIEQENMVTIGPFNRFARGNGRSIFLHMVAPGWYRFYGPVFTAAAAPAGNCMCMGSVEFEVKPGQIVDAGTMTINFLAERQRAKEAGQPLPKTELDLPEGMNGIGWGMPQGGVPDPRLAGYTVVPAELHAAGRVPNYFGITIDRLTALPGVLAYDRDTVIDVKTGKRLK